MRDVCQVSSSTVEGLEVSCKFHPMSRSLREISRSSSSSNSIAMDERAATSEERGVKLRNCYSRSVCSSLHSDCCLLRLLHWFVERPD